MKTGYIAILRNKYFSSKHRYQFANAWHSIFLEVRFVCVNCSSPIRGTSHFARIFRRKSEAKPIAFPVNWCDSQWFDCSKQQQRKKETNKSSIAACICANIFHIRTCSLAIVCFRIVCAYSTKIRIFMKSQIVCVLSDSEKLWKINALLRINKHNGIQYSGSINTARSLHTQPQHITIFTRI